MVLEKAPPSILKTSDCPVETVTVFTNTAEVTRLVHVQLHEGTQDVVIKGFSEHVDPNSLRVSAGKVKISILEVSYNEVREPVPEELNLELQEKQSQMKELDVLEAKLKNRNAEIEESKRIIESYAERLTDPAGEQTAEVSELLTEMSLKGIHEFVKIYKEKLAAFDFDQHELAKGLRDLRQQRTILAEEVKELQKTISETTHQVTIAVFAPEPASLILRLLYLVGKTKWTPSYDIRATSQDTHKIGITIFGVIQQATGEDWDKAKIILSTAKPSISGAPPSLIPQTIQMRSNSPARPPPRKRTGTGSDSKSKRKTEYEIGFNSFDEVEVPHPSTYSSSANATPPPEKAAQVLSVVLNVPRQTTIKCDDKPHKVVIMVADLDAKFTHTAIPRLEQRAYLKAYITNSTDHPFLAGPAAIFLENSFVATISLPDISPQENFEAHLGVDPTVKVEYRPVHKHKELGGLVSKLNSQVFSHKTVIKNTKHAEIDITVIDQYPKSTDEKIRVRLLEPAQEEGPNHAVNDAHNIEWRFNVAPGEAPEINYSYAVEWPPEREVDVFFSSLVIR